MKTSIRKFSQRKDKKAAHRVWQECGWVSDEKRELDAMDLLVKASDGWVFEMNGEAECLVLSTPGKFTHTGTDLSLSAITAVTTSRIARNLGAASKTLAHCLADQARKGMQTSGLGIFEQGFYERLGYGSGTYEHWIRFDPAWLIDFGKPRVPIRLSADDWKETHEARFSRRKLHGAVDLIPGEISRAEMGWRKKSFGLGYRDGPDLTHYVWFHSPDDSESGPYAVGWMAYQTLDQFKELLGLMRGLGDQVRLIRMREPRDVQIQTLLRKPFQLYNISERSKRESKNAAVAYWQMRIMDLPGCIGALKCDSDVAFNLSLDDPIADHLPADASWRGCGGEYVVHLGRKSVAELGADDSLPTLKTDVCDLTRFWMGAARAEVLATFGTFDAPANLLTALDQAVNLPLPDPDWDY